MDVSQRVRYKVAGNSRPAFRPLRFNLWAFTEVR